MWQRTCIAFFGLVCEVIATSTTATTSRCLPPELTNNHTFLGDGKKLRLEQNSWLGHAVTTQTAALLLREVLGFEVEVVPDFMTWGDPNASPLSRLASGAVDANLEAWKIDWPPDLLEEHLLNGTVDQSIHGFDGRVGLYIPAAVIEDTPALFPEYWRSFKTVEVLEMFRYANDTELQQQAESWAGNCADIYGCDSGTSRWTPPRCEGQNCIPILHVYPEYAVGWIEQLIQNLELNFTVYYAGEDIYGLVDELTVQRRGVIFYSWRPHEFLSTGNFRRIAFPERNHQCEVRDTSDRFGGRDCDHEGEFVYKITTKSLPTRSIAASAFLKSYSLQLEDQDSMLAAAGPGGVPIEEAVCNWAKAHSEEWLRWVPDLPLPACDAVKQSQIDAYPLRYHDQLWQCVVEDSSDDDSETYVLLATVLGAIVGVAAVLVIVYGIYVQYKRYVRALKAMRAEKAARRKRVVSAVMGSQELHYGFCVISYKHFHELGKLVRHEEARDKGQLITLDTWKDAMSFVNGHVVAFISHQWLSKTTPDPDRVHFKAICNAIDALMQQDDVLAEDVFIWVDYTCIPQKNRSVQLAAVSSIAAYAGCCNVFISIVPPTEHKDTKQPCDGASYSRRGWCRLEQMSYILVHGLYSANIFDTQLHQFSEKEGWLQTAIDVFSGEFSVEKDKELLVDVLLGLYGFTVLAKYQDDSGLLDMLQQHKSRVFPSSFFGDLVNILEDQLESGRQQFDPSPAAPVHSAGSKSSGPCEFSKEGFEELIELRDTITAVSRKTSGPGVGYSSSSGAAGNPSSPRNTRSETESPEQGDEGPFEIIHI